MLFGGVKRQPFAHAILPFSGAHPDRRVDDWLLMGDFRTILLITAAYLLVIHLGRKFMASTSVFSRGRGQSGEHARARVAAGSPPPGTAAIVGAQSR